MSKIFYDHLVVREEVSAELAQYKLTSEELAELKAVIDETLHHHVLDEILTHLPVGKHKEFLKKLHAKPHDETLLEYLKVETMVDIELKIRDRAKTVKKTLLNEIRRSRRK